MYLLTIYILTRSSEKIIYELLTKHGAWGLFIRIWTLATPVHLKKVHFPSYAPLETVIPQ